MQNSEIFFYALIHLCYRVVELTTKQAILKMVKCRSFYVMWFSTLCAALGLEFVLANYKVYIIYFASKVVVFSIKLKEGS